MMQTGKDIRKRFAVGLLRYGIKHYPDHFQTLVKETVLKVSKDYIDQEMQARGLLHCHFCNNRFSLKKVSGVYVCRDHNKILLKAEQKESAKLEVV